MENSGNKAAAEEKYERAEMEIIRFDGEIEATDPIDDSTEFL